MKLKLLYNDEDPEKKQKNTLMMRHPVMIYIILVPRVFWKRPWERAWI